MSRLRRRDRLLLAVLVPIWLGAFLLFAYERVLDRPTRPALLTVGAASDDAYPRIAAYRPGFESAIGGLQNGDELLRLGTRDARGLSAVGVLAQSLAAADAAGRIEVEYRRGATRATTSISLLQQDRSWRTALLALGFAATAVLLILRVPGSRVAQTFLPAVLVWSLCWIEFTGQRPAQTWAFFLTRVVAGCLWAPLMLRAALNFPEEVAPRRRVLWPWLFLPLGLTWSSRWFGTPLPIEFGMRANPALGALVIAALLFVLTRNYRRAGAAGRRQVKWVLLGVYLGTLPVLAADAAAALDPHLLWLWDWSQIALLAVPIAIFIAITRANLLDIDRLISTTATYSLLLTLVVGGALTALPTLAAALAQRSGLRASTVQLGLAFAIAPLVVGCGRWLRPHLEGFFFAESRALEREADALLRELASSRDAEALIERAGRSLETLLRPASCVIYGRAGPRYAPVFLSGARVAPSFDDASPLLRALAQRRVIDLEHGRRALERAGAGAEERGAIGSLGAELLLAIDTSAGLVGFVALGRKRSGDVYSGADRALLAAVAAAIGSGLERCGEKELLHEAQALQERLRRYVPGALHAELATGRSTDPGEREVTVLFADLRAYSSLAQERRPDEIFAALSRYAYLVADRVVQHGGHVVEFAGDGIMAVFGAPGVLDGKEAAALRAAREITAELGALDLFPGAARRAGPAMGVGIATGKTYVGTIHAVDRDIWSAVGNTTNLAARLQSLTRELGVSIAIDAATWRAAASAASDLTCRPRTPIRGLRDTQDVYVI